MNASELTPLLLALVLGGLIGLEREWSGRPAGLRTHILVCVSATMLMVVSRVLADSDPSAGRLVFDPNRMGAGIVTGIGFLGAGTVMRSADFLRGLTTAACIWFVAGLGIVIGSHEYGLAVAATLCVLFVLTVVSRFDRVIHPVLYRRLVVDAATTDAQGLVDSIRTELERLHMRVLDLTSSHFADEQRCELVFYISLKKNHVAPGLTERVAALAGVTSARWKLIT